LSIIVLALTFVSLAVVVPAILTGSHLLALIVIATSTAGLLALACESERATTMSEVPKVTGSVKFKGTADDSRDFKVDAKFELTKKVDDTPPPTWELFVAPALLGAGAIIILLCDRTGRSLTIATSIWLGTIIFSVLFSVLWAIANETPEPDGP
jgi:hypothetical protein